MRKKPDLEGTHPLDSAIECDSTIIPQGLQFVIHRELVPHPAKGSLNAHSCITA